MAQAGLLDLLNMATGNTGQDRVSRFVDNELPALAQKLYQAQSAEEVANNAAALIGAAQKAGYGPKNVQLLLDRLVEPARANLGASELQKIGARFKTDITQQPSEVAGLRSADLQGLSGLMTPDKLKDIPGKKFDQSDALDIAQVGARFGMKTPEGLAQLLTAPSAVDENLGQAEAATALAAERRRQEQIAASRQTTLENLSDRKDAETGLSVRDVGMGSGGSGLASVYTNARNIESEAPERASRVDLNRSRQTTEGARQGELGTRSQANVALADRRRREDDIGGETTVETERMVRPEDQLVAERTIARVAKDRGATTPEQIAKIADDLGYELIGEATLETTGDLMGLREGTIKLAGNFSLRPKPQKRITTKGKPKPGERAISTTAAPQPAAVPTGIDERRKQLRAILSGQ